MKATLRVALAVLIAVGFAAVAARPAPADVIIMEVHTLDFLLGAGAAPVDTLKTTIMNAGNLRSTVYSQAYTDGAGLYAYLYQIENTGTVGNSPLEQFTLWPFTGATTVGTSAGWLGGDLPAGFLTGTAQAAEGEGWSEVLTSGPQLSFYYSLRAHQSVDIGEKSVVMYVLSHLAPDEITGNVIDGSVASGPVVGPLPEPATLALMAAGAVLALVRRRRNV